MNMLIENAAQAAFEQRQRSLWKDLPEWARQLERESIRSALGTLLPPSGEMESAGDRIIWQMQELPKAEMVWTAMVEEVLR